MEGRKSKLAKLIDNDFHIQEVIKKQVLETGSCLGAKFTLNGKKYIITDGDTSQNFYNSFQRIEVMIRKYSKNY